ncbi:MAG: helix-turn-helix domain-containing protein [Candidatus Staskawiczbacteria bacterium]|jgi:DNA-binding transcriptional ArsR family regulator
MKNNLSKTKAIKLRKNGLSYGEIAKKLSISKSTLSYWLKEVLLTEEQRKRLYTNNITILARGAQSQKERRKREIDKILEEAGKEIHNPVAAETYKILGAALYWAEGSKTNGLNITNSDPHLILFMVRWFEKIFGIAPKDLKAWLNIYPQQNDLEIKQFWSQLTNIPIERFGKSFIKPLNKNYKKNNLYYGTISVRVPKGTDARYKIFGWIKEIMKEVNSEVVITQKEWHKLTEVSRAINI